MRLKWYKLDEPDYGPPTWQLHLVKIDAHGMERTVDILGSLAKLNRAWRIMERKIYVKPDMYWLDAELTLEEAQRAAKLFLCVGRQ